MKENYKNYKVKKFYQNTVKYSKKYLTIRKYYFILRVE